MQTLKLPWIFLFIIFTHTSPMVFYMQLSKLEGF
jgi:hypothetical protein